MVFKKGYNNPMFGVHRFGKNNPFYGKKHSEESKRKIKENHKNVKGKNHPFYGKHHSKETKDIMRLLKIDKKLSIKHKQNLSKSLKGREFSKEHRENLRKIRIGKKNSEETIRKIKMARTNQIFPIKDTKPEIKIQNFLKQLGIEFYTHQYIKNIEHGYQCDILIPSQEGIERPTIIECFGDYWHKIPYGNPIDSVRCQELRTKGFRVFVFWEREIKAMELNDFKIKIRNWKNENRN